MKVLLITGSFPPMQCGVGDYSYNLAKALVAHTNLEVGVLTSILGAREYKSESMAIFPIIKTWSITEALRAIKVIRQWSPDVIHIQYPTLGYGAAHLPNVLPMISFLMGAKVVQTWHEVYLLYQLVQFALKSMVPSTVVYVRPHYKENLTPILRWLVRNKSFAFIKNSSIIPRIDLDEQTRAGLRKGYLGERKRLIAFLGFVAPNKGVELLFDIADPSSDQIVIAGKVVGEGGDYHSLLMKRASTYPWQSKVTFSGFLSRVDAASLLAVADAIVLPFRAGGGEWNTTIHAAVLQGTFVVTTSLIRNGYDPGQHIYYAKVDDVDEMKFALDTYADKRRNYHVDANEDEWKLIADKHRSLYQSLLSE